MREEVERDTTGDPSATEIGQIPKKRGVVGGKQKTGRMRAEGRRPQGPKAEMGAKRGGAKSRGREQWRFTDRQTDAEGRARSPCEVSMRGKQSPGPLGKSSLEPCAFRPERAPRVSLAPFFFRLSRQSFACLCGIPRPLLFCFFPSHAWLAGDSGALRFSLRRVRSEGGARQSEKDRCCCTRPQKARSAPRASSRSPSRSFTFSSAAGVRRLQGSEKRRQPRPSCADPRRRQSASLEWSKTPKLFRGRRGRKEKTRLVGILRFSQANPHRARNVRRKCNTVVEGNGSSG